VELVVASAGSKRGQRWLVPKRPSVADIAEGKRCWEVEPEVTGKVPPRPLIRAARTTRRGPSPPDFPLENQSEKSIISYHFAFRTLSFL
jgi:hypothetical protein